MCGDGGWGVGVVEVGGIFGVGGGVRGRGERGRAGGGCVFFLFKDCALWQRSLWLGRLCCDTEAPQNVIYS